MKMLKASFVACMFVFVSSIASPVFSQTETASLSGRVTDPHGAVVPHAAIEAIQNDTNLKATTETNNDGLYYLPSLHPGSYRVVVSKVGFKQIIEANVLFHVQDVLTLNFALELGSVSESVTVTAEGTDINTTSATVSTTIDRNFAENIPLNGRSFQTLILLAPGTALSTVGENGGSFTVNGQRTNANSFTVDGVSANLGGLLAGGFAQGQLNGNNPNFTTAGTTQGLVSVDALQEFKIQTSTYAPEFGRQPGGQVSLLTRSGTNAFHGTAFDYLRNTDLDANNWFNDRATPPIPKGIERQNDFGGTIGGPILKDNTFFFFSYEGLRLLQPDTELDQVPSLRVRQEAAPAYQAILNSWPLPEGPEFTVPNPGPCTPPVNPCPPIPTGAAPYTFSQSFPTNIDSYVIKFDHSFGKRTHLFGRYSDTFSALSFPNSAPNNTENDKLKSRSLTLGLDTEIQPNIENELRLNYAVSVTHRVVSLNIVGGATTFDTSVLYPAPLVLGADAATWQLNLPNAFFSTGPASGTKLSVRQANVIDNVSLSVGSHQLKWGVDYRRLFPIYDNVRLGVTYIITSENDLAAGNVSQAQTGSNIVSHPIYTNLSFYIQDKWKASNRLTLTYGIRWDFNPVPGERDGIQPFNVIGIDDPATATLAPLNSPMYKSTYNNFAPRVGLAYQVRQAPRHETVVRGGLGLFYDLNSETTAFGFGSAPFVNNSQVLTTLPGTSNPLPFPVPANVLPFPPIPAPTTPPFDTIFAINPNLKLPYTLQWNVSVEQSLGSNQTLTVSYVAAAGYRLLRNDRLFHFNPLFTNIQVVQNSASSNYQSLQLQFNRRLSQGLQALGSYTYSHSIDDASNAETFLSTSASGTNFLNPTVDRGSSDFDVRHAFRGALTYNIPAWNESKLSRTILGGWSTDAIGIAQTGQPADLIGGVYFPNGGFLLLRPNVVLGQPLYLHGAQCASVFQASGTLPPGQACPGGMGFNPAAFVPVPRDANGFPTQEQGTLGRNVMRRFGAWQMDFALHRQFNITERVNLQFRSEFFNVFNHPNFAMQNTQFVGHGQFGVATSTLNNALGGLNSLYQIGGPRSIQLALKLSF
jgi:hypothetical protein